MRVFVLGTGKVGSALARAAKAGGADVSVRSARKALPRKKLDVDLLILAVRDRDIHPMAVAIAERRLVGKTTACVHVAGALDEGVLEPLRPLCAGVAQMHPLIAFASRRHSPSLEGGWVHVRGDGVAVRRARSFARLLGMTPQSLEALDLVGYHAAAGLVANGAAALAALGAELLANSGIPRESAPNLLGPLLRSVAENVEALGFPEALTGPVRRGDHATLSRHVATLRVMLPEAVPLYLASARAQLPLARALGEAPETEMDALASWLSPRRRRR